MNTVIFDLDGTLSDSAEGIVKSINYALQKLGFKELPKEDLLQYIGPPLNITFGKLTGMQNNGQRPLGQSLAFLDIHRYRQDLFDRTAAVSTGTETVLTAHHQKSGPLRHNRIMDRLHVPFQRWQQ